MTTIIESCPEQATLMVDLCKLVWDECKKGDTPQKEATVAVIKNKVKALGYQNFKWFEKDITQAFVARDKKTRNLVICFRGSNDLQDWISNVRYCQRKAEKGAGKVHTGFVASLNHVYRDVLKYVEKNYDGNGITCMGHSLGGALATLMASRLANRNKSYVPIEIYTFGSPRVGNKKFVKALDKKDVTHHRFVNNNDCVPKLPWFQVYHHHGDLYYIDYDGNIHTTKSLTQTAKDQFRARRRARQKEEPFDYLYDHFLKRYHKKIGAFCS